MSTCAPCGLRAEEGCGVVEGYLTAQLSRINCTQRSTPSSRD